MKNLADLYELQKTKDKRINTALKAGIVLLSVILIALLSCDPWEIAYQIQEKKDEVRREEFAKVYKEYLLDEDYLEAFAITYSLPISENDQLYSLLSDCERIVTYIRNAHEGNSHLNYENLDYLVDNFYREYFYLKTYSSAFSQADKIDEFVREYLLVYGLMDEDSINMAKERNKYE